ncbi:hypothetical protein EAH_00066070 [Eimeria acervulina]|uniref:Uncharacterized protein n=1 Tax=Eimeria acervulina TaxID=5801 RepID=U6GRY5_EIMAC|nr:hypothetical protein EAH_00066070 [Eimeria acervulina]CDI82342.1 hypothetical protein EAH_00066070 [Eimeria acervulina]
MRRICVLRNALDLAAAALWIEWGWGQAKRGCSAVECLSGGRGRAKWRYLVVRLRRRYGGCVAFSVYCHTGCANKCKLRRICVLKATLDLAAAALWIEWGWGGAKWRNIVKQAKWNVGSWLGGFEWRTFVGVDGFAYGKTGS